MTTATKPRFKCAICGRRAVADRLIFSTAPDRLLNEGGVDAPHLLPPSLRSPA